MAEESSSSNWFSSAASGGMIIAPIISSLISANAAKQGSKRTNRQNKAAAELAFQRDKEMWELQNQYNSPSAQMSRFAAAGLNPKLIYGQGNAGNASSHPQYNAPKLEGNYPVFDPSSVMTGLAQFQDFQLRQAQIDNVRAQTDNVNQRTSNDILFGVLKQIGIDTSSFDLRQKQELERYSQEALRLRTGILRQQHSMNIDRQWRIMNEAKASDQLPKQAATKTEMMQAELLFKQYENQFRSMGIQSGDNVLLRMLLRAFAENGFDPSKLFK